LSRSIERPPSLSGRISRGLAVTVITTLLIATLLTSDSRTVQTFTTQVGKTLTLPLPDGSTITLNTDSIVRMSHESNVLHFNLLRGEALFAMTPDPNRHLLVSAAEFSITEAGTVFSVRRVDDGGIRITVESGAIYLVSTHTPRTLVSSNQQVLVTEHEHHHTYQKVSLTTDQVKDELAWTTGEIVFHCATVADAAREFSRYNERVRIEAQNISPNVRVVGRFNATDPQSFAESVAALLPNVTVQLDQESPDHSIARLVRIPPTHPTQQTPEHQCQPPSLSRL
jgi:transmembrane sensor